MKVSIMVLVIAVCLIRPLSAADDTSLWRPAALPIQANGVALRSVWFAGQNGRIVGDKGLCLLTTDGGKTWQVGATGTTAALRCVRFKDAKNGWACGDGDPQAPKPSGHIVGGRPMLSGVLLATTDGGKTWALSWVPSNFQFTSLEISAAPLLQVGMSGGPEHLDGDIMRSGNNGKDWEGERCFRALFDIRAIDKDRWLAVGSPVTVGFSPPPTEPLYLQKGCRALVSVNGGKNWSASSGSEGDSPLRSLALASSGVAIAVGDNAAILRSKDKGKSWQKIECKTPRDLLAVVCGVQDSKQVLATGNTGCVLVSQDEGMSWRAIVPPAAGNLHGAAAVKRGFWVVGENGAFLADATALTKAPAKELKPAPVNSLVDLSEMKEPTAAQRTQVHVGNSVIYAFEIDKPEGKLTYKVKYTVTEVSNKQYRLRQEVVEGNAPSMPKDKDCLISELIDYNNWKIDECRQESPQTGVTLTKTRRANEKFTAGKTEFTCVVIETKMSNPYGVSVTLKNGFDAQEKVPMGGLVYTVSITEMAGPNGKTVETQKMTLVEFNLAQ